MSDFKFEITEHLGTLSENARGWTKELNKVSFNERPAKYDLREWDPDHQKMSKGVTLSDEEMEILSKILKDKGI
ncbi:YdbC family protein [Peptoniphilus harei]|uniref:YdbC family protein n=1 Tax=Peptoniphilus harei TaxID=54005 RepID=A0A943SS66_9FIRM|nr:YdbC family protein [Peptoniphilus harei]MBS6535812.1 YdbC family protein [Peptoniphilus harei]